MYKRREEVESIAKEIIKECNYIITHSLNLLSIDERTPNSLQKILRNDNMVALSEHTAKLLEIRDKNT